MLWELRAVIVLTAVVIGIGFNSVGEADIYSSGRRCVSSNWAGSSKGDKVIVASGARLYSVEPGYRRKENRGKTSFDNVQSLG